MNFTKWMRFAMLVLVLVVTGFAGAASARDKVLLVTDEWPPYYSASIANQGFVTQVVKEAYKAVGYDVEVRFLPWERVMAMAKSGEADGIMGAYYKKEREADFKYSAAIAESQLSFYKQKSKPHKYSSLNDVKGKTVGIVRGYTFTPEFDQSPAIKKDQSDNLPAALRKLLAGRVDFVLDDQRVIAYELKKMGGQAGDAEALTPPLQVSKLFVLISKKAAGSDKKLGDFNRGLDIIKKNGTYARLMGK